MILWGLYIIADAVINWFWIEKKKKYPNYILLTITRMWAFILTGISIDLQPHQFWPWLIFCGASFWIMFDLLLNQFRGKPLTYIGITEDEGGDSKLDMFGQKYPVIYWILKAFALALVIVIILNKL